MYHTTPKKYYYVMVYVHKLVIHTIPFREREHGLKETLYLMGMSRTAYLLSWIITYAIALLFPITAMVWYGWQYYFN